MAIIYRCDKCKADSLDENNLTRIELEYDNVHSSYNTIIIKTNICPKCMRDLKDWLNTRIEEKSW